MKKRFLSLIAALAMIMAIMPSVPAIAEDEPRELPVIELFSCTDITQSSARFAANVSGDMDITARRFEYYPKNDSAARYVISADESFTASPSNLAPDTEYCYYAVAVTSEGTARSETKSFTTAPGYRVQSVALNTNSVTIGRGGKEQPLARVLPETAENREIVWSSSDESIASVDQTGMITGVNYGTAVIRAASADNRNIRALCEVNVVQDVYMPHPDDIDFSEWNMETNTREFAEYGYFKKPGQGGGYAQTTAYWARWDGPILEKDDPYPVGINLPDDEDWEYMKENYHELDAEYHIQDVDWLNGRKATDDPTDDLEYIKSAVMNYGAVFANYYEYTSGYSENRTYFYMPDEHEIGTVGHVVAIVGWDDNIPAEKFKAKINITDSETVSPPGPGAFICKNSHGVNRGEDGYFYISYYTKSFLRNYINENGNEVNRRGSVVRSVEYNTNYNTIYQYDPLGAITSLSYNSKSLYEANVFPEHGKSLDNDEILRAVAFYTYNCNTSYEIYILTDYMDKQDLNNLGSPVETGTIANMGYHTITLTDPINLKTGSRFAVVIKLSTEDEDVRAYVERTVTLSTGQVAGSNCTAGIDESYLSKNGKTWTDMCMWNNSQTNMCIKAFTDNGRAGTSPILYDAIDNADRPVPTYADLMSAADNEDEGPEIMEEIYELDADGDALQVNMPISENIPDNTDGLIFPERYDLRDLRQVTPIRDQRGFGSCWAHAACASLESFLMKKAYGTDIRVAEVELDKNEVTIANGNSFNLNAAVYPLNAANKSVTWSSGDENVAVVDTNGRVTTKAIGEAVITATTVDGGYTAQCRVTVKEGEPVERVELADETLSKKRGDIFMLDYEIYPANAQNLNVIWESGDPDILSVNRSGVITVLGSGTADITITTEDGGKSDTVTVTADGDSKIEIKGCTARFEHIENDLIGNGEITVVNSANPTDGTAILAVYGKGGELLGIKSEPVQLDVGERHIVINDMTVEGASDKQWYVKGFIWDSLNGMRPAAQCGGNS